jgi:hypothetical protein
MHTVELLEKSLEIAQRLGFEVRQEWLAGGCGGGCLLKGRKVLFVDLDLGPDERLEQVIDAIVNEPDIGDMPMPRELWEMIKMRKDR